MSKPLDKATILVSRDKKRLNKIFTAHKDGTIEKTDYQNAFFFLGEEAPLNNIDDFYNLQKSLINEPYKMIVRGELIDSPGKLIKRRMKNEGASIKPMSHHWVMHDIDKLELPPHVSAAEDPEEAFKHAIKTLPEIFWNKTCVWQLSSSQCIPNCLGEEPPNTLSGHIAFWCDRKISDEEWKTYFKSQPSYSVDLALYNPIQAHYTCAPDFENMDDPLHKRLGLLRDESDVVEMPEISVSKPSTKKPRSQTEYTPVSEDNRENALKKFAEKYPEEGGRGDFCAAIAGTLRRNAWETEDTAEFIFELADLVDDEQAHDRQNAALRICEAVDNDEPAQGIPRLKEYFQDNALLNEVFKLLGIYKAPENKTPKTKILVLGGTLSRQATRGEQALIDAGLPIYQRGSQLVKPIVQETEASKGRQTKIAVLHPLSKTRMRDHLCEVARWEQPSEDDDPKFIDPPVKVADTILNRYGAWKFPSLAGVIMTPTLRPDGSLLSDLGYDKTTRLYLLDKPDMPEIASKPTKDEAIKAIKSLEKLLTDFPFVNDASKSVALSALMTPIIRGGCKVVPMHVVSAPTPGTGKSYLLDISSGIATGQPCPIIAAGKTEEETEKRLFAALLTGQSILSIDSLNGDLTGDAVCQAIERPFFTSRILGKSENATIETRSTLFANGNNIRLKGDITRRSILCLMDAEIERPELRSFNLDPFQMVINNRGKYIAAVLTIARAYIEAGMPDVIKPKLASFEDWSDLVRSCLVWLDYADPLETMEQVRSEDPELLAMSNVFQALWDVTEGDRYTSKQIIGLALGADVGTWEHDETKANALKEALMNVAADNKGFITTLRLGQWLSRNKGRVRNNLRLENEVDRHGHPAKWWLVKLDNSGSED